MIVDINPALNHDDVNVSSDTEIDVDVLDLVQVLFFSQLIRIKITKYQYPFYYYH